MYRLTDAGSAALAAWLREPPTPTELRDEGLLKLFFAAPLSTDEAVELLRSVRAAWEEPLAQLREVERNGHATGYPALVLDFGIGMKQWMVDWCRNAEHRLQNEKGVAR